jgi:PhnB protein
MTTSLSPYLNFDGKTEEAMKFYAEAIGGSLEIHRFGDAPMPCPPEQKNRIMHATLRHEAIVLMASDTMPGQPLKTGSQVHLSLNFSDKGQQDAVWGRLSAGATVTMPLGDQFFGRFGMLVDKFGIQWMLHFQPAK